MPPEEFLQLPFRGKPFVFDVPPRLRLFNDISEADGLEDAWYPPSPLAHRYGWHTVARWLTWPDGRRLEELPDGSFQATIQVQMPRYLGPLKDIDNA